MSELTHAQRLALARKALTNYSEQFAQLDCAHGEAIHARCNPYDIDTLGERVADARAIVGKLERYIAALEKQGETK
jgi:hypothetical protein